MPFEPFGYRFDISSTKSPVEAKAAIRAGLKGWLDPKTGPRGWIAGPVVCLWRSAFDRHGPMLIAWITADNFGTHVRGRAGSDLNGTAVAVVVFPLLALLFYNLLRSGATSIGQTLVFAAVLMLSPMIFWFAHKDRRQAEPLVEFVRRALGVVRPAARRVSVRSGPFLPMLLTVGTNPGEAVPATADAVCEAVAAIEADPDSFLVLATEDERYMQVASPDGVFVLEKREGSEANHFVAKRAAGDGNSLSADEITEALLDYLEGRPSIPGIRWDRLYR
jgi:hypothetical protein